MIAILNFKLKAINGKDMGKTIILFFIFYGLYIDLFLHIEKLNIKNNNNALVASMKCKKLIIAEK